MAATLKALKGILSRFEEPLLIGDPSGPCIVVSRRFGARIMGASPKGLEGPNVIWTNPDLGDESFHSDASRNWNVGGHRTWLAPEDRFYLDASENWFVPTEMDPGNYELVAEAGDAHLFSNRFDITDNQGNTFSLELSRRISLRENAPQGPDQNDLEDVAAVSFDVTQSLRNTGTKAIGKELPHAGIWSLLQVSPPGTVIIPTKGPPAYIDYFDPIPDDRRGLGEQVITFKIDGAKRGKMGISPQIAPEAVGYMSAAGSTPMLLVKQFSVDPQGTYLDKPWGKDLPQGDAVQTYNDDGEMGGFAELECHAPAQILEPDEEQSLTITISAFLGPLEKLKRVGSALLGIDLGNIHYFS
jgi:hypothetical protein